MANNGVNSEAAMASVSAGKTWPTVRKAEENQYQKKILQ